MAGVCQESRLGVAGSYRSWLMTEHTRGFPLWIGTMTLEISVKRVTCGTRAVLYEVHPLLERAAEVWPGSEDQFLMPMSLSTLETFLALSHLASQASETLALAASSISPVVLRELD